MRKGTPVSFTKHYDPLKNYLLVDHEEMHGTYERRKFVDDRENCPHTRPLVFDEVLSDTGEKFMVPAGHPKDISIF